MNYLFRDIPTKHRIEHKGKKRKVYARYDMDDRFVRYVARRSQKEAERIRVNQYAGADVGIPLWWEVQPWEFGS